MTEQLAELKAIAEKATQGPWEDFEHSHDEVYVEGGGDTIFVFSWLREDDHCVIPYDNAGANATHAATFDPPTVLSLITQLEEARRVIEVCESALAGSHDVCDYPGNLGSDCLDALKTVRKFLNKGTPG